MTVDLSQLCFIDCETTGLYPDRHVPWEIAIDVDGYEYLWNLTLTEEELGLADPMALKLSGFYERGDVMVGPSKASVQAARFSLDNQVVTIYERRAFAHQLVKLIDKRHLVGMVPSFDERFVGDFCRRQARPPIWHYHLIDVEPLVIGHLQGLATAPHFTPSQRKEIQQLTEPPWKSNDLSTGMGIDPGDFDRHTAMGDVRWTKALYLAVMNTDG